MYYFLLTYYHDLSCVLFADDTTLYDCDVNLNILVERFATKISGVIKFFEKMRLTLSGPKSKVLIVIPKKRNSKKLSVDLINEIKTRCA